MMFFWNYLLIFLTTLKVFLIIVFSFVKTLLLFDPFSYDLYSIYDEYNPILGGLPLPVSETMNNLVELYSSVFNTIILIFIVVLFLLVEVLLSFKIFQFNIYIWDYVYHYPVPFTHKEEHFIDIFVILIPTFIIIRILVPSLGFLYNEQLQSFDTSASFEVQITGSQWFWSYEYLINVDSLEVFQDWFGDVEDDSCVINYFFSSVINLDLPDDKPRLLEVDKPLILPVCTDILFSFSSSDVIHSFALPEMGMKVDCVPGRYTHALFNCFATGTYYGQCSELCGVYHGFMPICVQVVYYDSFFVWIVHCNFINNSLDCNMLFSNKVNKLTKY